MSTYTLTQKELTNLKSRLTKVLKKGGDKEVFEECRKAFAIFEAKGYPDCWHRWEIAKNDCKIDEIHR